MRQRRFLALLLAASAGLMAAGCSPSVPPPPVTLAIVNAVVWTGDPAKASAQAVAMAGDRIAAVGTTDEIRAMAGAVEVIDAHGQFVVPGFIDSHVHFLDGGQRLASVQLRDASSRDAFVSRIGAFAKTVPAGTWITGGDWDHTLWGGELPSRAWIDAVTPDHPVWVNRLDGHMALANSAALRAAGLTRDVKPVEGGEIVRDRRGELTGVLKDNAMALVDTKVPPPTPEMSDRALDAAMKYVAEQGVTSVDHMGTWEELDVFARANKAGRLATRIYAAVPLNTWQRLSDAVKAKTYGGDDGRGDAWLRIGNLKGFVDGSLGSHTAAFLEPFTDAPKDTGLFVTPPDDLFQWTSGADGAGLQVSVHAIGDKAIRTQLDIFERVAKEHGPRDRRFRIEHAQHISPPDIPRFGQLGVIASMQPYHAIDDGRWAEALIGPERIKTTYAFRSLLDSNAVLAFGSDWFVAPPTPLDGIYAAVTRRTLDDKNPGGWVPEQKITVEEALWAYTRAGAYATFDETRKGMIQPGFLADLVIIDKDLRAIPAPEIRHARIMRTIVGGKTVYVAPAAPPPTTGTTDAPATTPLNGAPPEARAAVAAVEAALKDYDAQVTAMNAAGIAKLYAPNGEMVDGTTLVARGPAAIREHLQGFNGQVKVKRNISLPQQVGVNGDTVVLLGVFQQEAQILKDGKLVTARGQFEARWKRQADGRWLIERMSTAAQ